MVHALTGCSTTSALFGQGKVGAFKHLIGKPTSISLTDILSRRGSSQNEVADAGCQLLVMLYGRKKCEKLNSLRRSMQYMNMCSAIKSKVVPERLPPTNRAAYFHCLCVHLQILQWESLSTEDCGINATDWGWGLQGNNLIKTVTDREPAPEDLLKVIRCTCKASSKKKPMREQSMYMP